MSDTDLMVTITQRRYEQLLDTETRVDVVVERIINKDYFEIEDVLRILGTELALQKANEIREKNRKLDDEYNKKRKKEGNA